MEIEAIRTLSNDRAEDNDSKDWRDEGVVSEVKDQGMCGSCWAFSATGGFESFMAMNGKGVKDNMVLVSEQELVDCDKTCYGCGGGWVDKALNYIKANSIATEDNYSYVGRNRQCSQSSKDKQPRYGIQSFVAKEGQNV